MMNNEYSNPHICKSIDANKIYQIAKIDCGVDNYSTAETMRIRLTLFNSSATYTQDYTIQSYYTQSTNTRKASIIEDFNTAYNLTICGRIIDEYLYLYAKTSSNGLKLAIDMIACESYNYIFSIVDTGLTVIDNAIQVTKKNYISILGDTTQHNIFKNSIFFDGDFISISTGLTVNSEGVNELLQLPISVVVNGYALHVSTGKIVVLYTSGGKLKGYGLTNGFETGTWIIQASGSRQKNITF